MAAHLQDGDLSRQSVTLLLQEAPGSQGVQQPEPAPQDRVSAESSTQPHPQASPGTPSRPSAARVLPSAASQPRPSLFLGRMYLLFAYLTVSTPAGIILPSALWHWDCDTSCLHSPPHHSPSPTLKLFCGFPPPNLRMQVLGPSPLLASVLGYFRAAT